MRFRELSLGDARAVAELEAILFAGDSPWPVEAFRHEFRQPHTFYVGAFDEGAQGAQGAHGARARHEAQGGHGAPGIGGALAGYAGLAMLGPREDPEFEVHTIGVAPAYQGRGLGRKLMDQLMHTADLLDGPVFLEVRTDNAPAIGLYESFDFFTTATRRGYYQPSGADAYSMMRRRKSERQQGRPRPEGE